MKEKIENQEIKDYLIKLSTDRLQNCEVFTRAFGKRFAKSRLKTNLGKVYTNEINKKCSGYANTKGEGESTITICCKTEISEPLSVDQISEDPEFESIALHEAIHIILEKTKRECKKASIDSGTGILEQTWGVEIGRGLNEGLTNWIVRKTGLSTNSYKTLTNFIEELELAISEDNVMALGKGNLYEEIPKLLEMDYDECLRIFGIGDEIYKVNDQISNYRIILYITKRYLMRDKLDSEDREEAETQYKELLQTEPKKEYYKEESAYQTFLQEENKSDTPENRKEFFENQLKEKKLRHLNLKTKFESIIYEKYFEDGFEKVMESGQEPELQQLRKWEELWDLITDEGVQGEIPISEFKEKYEMMREQYLENISLEAEKEFNDGNLSGKKLVELLKKSSGFGNDMSNMRLLSNVAQLIAPNYKNAIYVRNLLASLDFEQLEQINKHKISIATYCAGNVDIPVYMENGKIVSIFLPYCMDAFSQMKNTSEKELKDENAMIFDYTADLEEDGYTTAKEEALQIYQEALNRDASTKMKILDRMIVLENRDGTQTPYIISSGHVLPAFAQKGSTLDIHLAPNKVELPIVRKENVFSRLMTDIKRKFLKNPEGDIYYDNAINEKSKIFRESMRIEEEEEENTEANNSFGTKQNEIEENRTKDNGLPR